MELRAQSGGELSDDPDAEHGTQFRMKPDTRPECSIQPHYTMKVLVISTLLAVLIAPILSAGIISLFFMSIYMYIFVLIFSWIGVAMIGFPASLILELALRRMRRGRFFLSLLLHGAAGWLLVAAYSTAMDEGNATSGDFDLGLSELFMPLCGMINALMYCVCLYSLRSWGDKRWGVVR